MSNEYPLFTVIIPQKDRAEYIGHTLRTCMIQDYPNFEIIVSDDCSEDNSVEVIESLCRIDSRIKLFAHKKHLGMRDNFEFALSQVRPGYVMALGGDDGLVPGCIWRMYEIFKETGRDLLTWAPSGFIYPSINSKNLFYVKRRKKQNLRFIKSEDFLNKIAKNFFYMADECPMFYVQGVASTKIVERVKSRTPDHSFYYCPTPDGFSGVVLAGEVEDYVYCNEPLSVIGSTDKSQGRNYHRTDKKSREESEQFFNDNIRRTMHKELASQQYSPLIPLMTADYLLTARDLPGWPGRFEMFSFESLILETFKFIETSAYEDEVLIRELKILREIAVQHGLLTLFNDLMKTTKRKRKSHVDPFGMSVTNSLRFEGTEIGIYNIFDAAIATPFVYNFYNRCSFSLLFEILKNTFRIYVNSKRFVVKPMPDIF